MTRYADFPLDLGPEFASKREFLDWAEEHLSRGQTAPVVEVLPTIPKPWLRDPVVRYVEGTALAMHGRFADAIESLQYAAQRGLLEARANLMKAYRELGLFTLAAKEAKEILKQGKKKSLPSDVFAAAEELTAGLEEESRVHGEQWGIPPHKAWRALEARDRGLLAMLTGSPRKAKMAFEQSLRLSPRWPSAWNNLALLALLQGKREEARQSLEQALKFEPDNLFAYTIRLQEAAFWFESPDEETLQRVDDLTRAWIRQDEVEGGLLSRLILVLGLVAHEELLSWLAQYLRKERSLLDQIMDPQVFLVLGGAAANQGNDKLARFYFRRGPEGWREPYLEALRRRKRTQNPQPPLTLEGRFRTAYPSPHIWPAWLIEEAVDKIIEGKRWEPSLRPIRSDWLHQFAQVGAQRPAGALEALLTIEDLFLEFELAEEEEAGILQLGLAAYKAAFALGSPFEEPKARIQRWVASPYGDQMMRYALAEALNALGVTGEDGQIWVWEESVEETRPFALWQGYLRPIPEEPEPLPGCPEPWSVDQLERLNGLLEEKRWDEALAIAEGVRQRAPDCWWSVEGLWMVVHTLAQEEPEERPRWWAEKAAQVEAEAREWMARHPESPDWDMAARVLLGLHLLRLAEAEEEAEAEAELESLLAEIRGREEVSEELAETWLSLEMMLAVARKDRVTASRWLYLMMTAPDLEDAFEEQMEPFLREEG